MQGSRGVRRPRPPWRASPRIVACGSVAVMGQKMATREELLGDGGAQAVVRPWCVVAGSLDTRRAHHKIRMGVDVAAIHVEDIRALHQVLTIEECKFDAVLPWFDLERESPRVAGRRALAFASLDVHDLDGSAFYPAGPLGSSYGTAD